MSWAQQEKGCPFRKSKGWDPSQSLSDSKGAVWSIRTPFSERPVGVGNPEKLLSGDGTPVSRSATTFVCFRKRDKNPHIRKISY